MKKLLTFITLIGLVILASTDDYQTEVLLEKDYCYRVNNGMHTDYKKLDCQNENNN